MGPESTGWPSAWLRLEQVGEGATSVVWKARRRDREQVAAVKLAKSGPEAQRAVAREALLLTRVGRRWGPTLIDAGAGFLVLEWVSGESLSRRMSLRADGADPDTFASMVAHAVGRALEELHQAGVCHGDVKADNVVVSTAFPQRDAADDRGATLIDLGLATELGATALGGTRRYAAPELRERGEAGPAADLWALGLLLAELLDPRIAASEDPGAVVWQDSARTTAREPARWVHALLARAPGGRPSAGWVAARAAQHLGLLADPEEQRRSRIDRVRRAYLRERTREVAPTALVSTDLPEPARRWMQDAVDWARRLAPPLSPIEVAVGDRPFLAAAPSADAVTIEPLSPVRRARWLVSLVGPAAAAWPMATEETRGRGVVARALELADSSAPEGWTLEDMLGRGSSQGGSWEPGEGADRTARLARELARSSPHPEAFGFAEDEVAAGRAPPTLALELASSLLRAGETGRAWAALFGASGPEVDALRAEVARRRGDVSEAVRAAHAAMRSGKGPPRWKGQATLARLAWDRGDLDAAEALLEDARGAAAAEVRALVAWRRGANEAGLRIVEGALAESIEGDADARLEAVRGLLELSAGHSGAAAAAFGRAAALATRAGAVVDEATYLTNDAAAASDAGDIARALASATRSALLWERLGRPAQAARAWLDRASALATIGAAHAAEQAAEEAYVRAGESGDVQAAAFARLAQAEGRTVGDPQGRAFALEADARLGAGSADDRARVAARLLVWAPDRIDDARVAEVDAAAASLTAAARWEWWGARATAMLAGRSSGGDPRVLGALLGLVEVPAPVGSRGPALDAAARLAIQVGDGASARRFEQARLAVAQILREGTPAEFRGSLATVVWARASTTEAADVAFVPAQVAQLESIVRALSTRDRLRPLLDQVLGTMILWTGVERGLLLLRAPDGRLVPRAARNLAGKDLSGDQLALSQTIAHRCIEAGEAVVATDAFSTLGDLHASVHALKLRSVLALPLIARGEVLGVVYLDDRERRGAFGPRELAWVRVVASQAAMAISDARDAVLLRRAVRRAERARARVEALLQEREVELDATRTQLVLARDNTETRYRYDAIAGRSAPMQELLKLLDRVTASDVPVLIVGESGTGKELVARAMHGNGPRARRTFVSENCASVPETLLESTLFGHVRGAFTGASSTRAGLFEVADGGTLLLDEIGEMSLAMQAKLLRVLQDGEVRPVGGERARRVDVRVLGATHRDLEAMVAAGQFREDLFYRLNVILLRVPPLRERSEDIPVLVDHFVRKHAQGAPVKVTRAAMGKLVSFSWPGNVRQLENELRRALVLGEGVIDLAELSRDVVKGASGASRGAGLDLRSRIDALESDLVVEALAKTRGNQTRAADLLGVSRFGLQKMMKRLKVAPQK